MKTGVSGYELQVLKLIGVAIPWRKPFIGRLGSAFCRGKQSSTGTLILISDCPPALQFGSGTCLVWFQVDLNESTGSALPFESLGQLRTLCLSPDGLLLLAIDVEGKALLINRKRQVLLHHFSFKGPVATARFSPDGQFIACAVQRLVQVSMSLHLQM